MSKHRKISIKNLHQRFEESLAKDKASDKVPFMWKYFKEDGITVKVEELSTKEYQVFYREARIKLEKQNGNLYYVVNQEDECIIIGERRLLVKSVREELHNIEKNKKFHE